MLVLPNNEMMVVGGMTIVSGGVIIDTVEIARFNAK